MTVIDAVDGPYTQYAVVPPRTSTSRRSIVRRLSRAAYGERTGMKPVYGRACASMSVPLSSFGDMAIDLELPGWLSRIGVFDLETTGVDVVSDRIVTAHVGVLDAKGRQIAARSWLADPGIPIPDGAAGVHGITTEHARRDGRIAREVVGEITESLRALFAQDVPVVAYNASYDFSLLTHECLRHGIAPLESPGPIIDPHVIDKAVDRYRKGKRTLEVVAAHYRV